METFELKKAALRAEIAHYRDLDAHKAILVDAQ
jgi:hypothetical protein